jgi:hypothetical protein
VAWKNNCTKEYTSSTEIITKLVGTSGLWKVSLVSNEILETSEQNSSILNKMNLLGWVGGSAGLQV